MDEVSFALEERKTVIPVLYSDLSVAFLSASEGFNP